MDSVKAMKDAIRRRSSWLRLRRPRARGVLWGLLALLVVGSLLVILLSQHLFLLGAACFLGFAAFCCYRYQIPRFALLLLAFSFLVRLAIVLVIDTPPVSDFETQYEAARLFAAGDMSFGDTPYFQTWGFNTGMVIYQGILLSICDSLLFLKIINCVVASITVVLVYAIAKEFFDPKASQCAAICYSVLVFPATFVTVLCNSIPSALFLYSGLYLFVAKKHDGMNWLLRCSLSGLLVAVGHALRPDGVIVAVALAGYFVVALVAGWSRRALVDLGKRALTLLGSFAVVIVLLSQVVVWSGVNSAGLWSHDSLLKFVFGTSLENEGGYNLDDLALIVERMEAEGLTRSEAETAIIKERLSAPPAELLELARAKINKLWWGTWGVMWSLGHLAEAYPDLYAVAQDADRGMSLWLLVAAAVGAVFLFWKRSGDPKKYIPLLVVAAAFFAYLAVEVQPRYVYLPQIAVAITAAGGIQAVASFIGPRKEPLGQEGLTPS